jgi:hypothetical protein
MPFSAQATCTRRLSSEWRFIFIAEGTVTITHVLINYLMAQHVSLS